MGVPEYSVYEKIREEGNSNADAARILGNSAAQLQRLGYAKRYNETHTVNEVVVRKTRPLKDYLNTDNEYYQNERAPRIALINKAN